MYVRRSGLHWSCQEINCSLKLHYFTIRMQRGIRPTQGTQRKPTPVLNHFLYKNKTMKYPYSRDMMISRKVTMKRHLIRKDRLWLCTAYKSHGRGLGCVYQNSPKDLSTTCTWSSVAASMKKSFSFQKKKIHGVYYKSYIGVAQITIGQLEGNITKYFRLTYVILLDWPLLDQCHLKLSKYFWYHMAFTIYQWTSHGCGFLHQYA